jgi:hypothetical protein
MLGGSDGTTLFMLTGPTSNPEEVRGKGLGRLECAAVTRPHAGLP